MFITTLNVGFKLFIVDIHFYETFEQVSTKVSVISIRSMIKIEVLGVTIREANLQRFFVSKIVSERIFLFRETFPKRFFISRNVSETCFPTVHVLLIIHRMFFKYTNRSVKTLPILSGPQFAMFIVLGFCP